MDRVSFYQRMILRKLGEVRESLGETRYRIYRETVEQSTDFEELRELAELELQIDLMKYTQEIQASLKAQGVTVEDLRREKGEKRPEEALFIEEEKSTLADDFRKIQVSSETAKAVMEDIQDELGEGDYDFEEEDYEDIEIVDEENLEEDYEEIEIEDEEELEEDYDLDAIEIEDEEELEEDYDIEIIDEEELEEDFEEAEIDPEEIEVEDDEDLEIEDEEALESEDEEDLGGFKFSGFNNEEEEEDDFDFDIEDEENLDGEPEYSGYDPAEELRSLGEGFGFNERYQEPKPVDSGYSRGAIGEPRSSAGVPIRNAEEPRRKIEEVKKATVFNTQTEKGRKNQDMMDLLSKGFKGTAKNIVKASNKLGESAGKLREKPFFKLDSEDDEDDDTPIKFN